MTTPLSGQFVVRRLGLAMINVHSCTKFLVSSLSRSRDILVLAMFNPRAKFEVSTITCNEDMKGNAKY